MLVCMDVCLVDVTRSGFMATDELFVLEGMHEVGAEQSLVEIREALEYYCFNFLRPWLQEYFYHKVSCHWSWDARQSSSPGSGLTRRGSTQTVESLYPLLADPCTVALGFSMLVFVRTHLTRLPWRVTGSCYERLELSAAFG